MSTAQTTLYTWYQGQTQWHTKGVGLPKMATTHLVDLFHQLHVVMLEHTVFPHLYSTTLLWKGAGKCVISWHPSILIGGGWMCQLQFEVRWFESCSYAFSSVMAHLRHHRTLSSQDDVGRITHVQTIIVLAGARSSTKPKTCIFFLLQTMVCKPVW